MIDISVIQMDSFANWMSCISMKVRRAMIWKTVGWHDIDDCEVSPFKINYLHPADRLARHWKLIEKQGFRCKETQGVKL